MAELWVHSFPGDRSLAERMQVLEMAGQHGGIETVLVAEEGGRLAGALKVTPFTQYLGGAALPAMGLAAVGIATWARREGLGSALCRYALEVSHDRGQVVSLLFPFRPEFYRRLGWGMVGELHEYRFAPEQLPAVLDGGVRLASPADMPAVWECYDRVARASQGMIARDEFLWKRHIDQPATHVFLAEQDVVRGYMVVRYARARSADRRPLVVKEVVAENDLARDLLWSWVSRQRDLWRRIRYDAPPDEHFGLRLIDPRPVGYRPARWLWARVARVIRGPMLRIVNVAEAFTTRLQWGPAPPFTFLLDVRDDVLPQNRRCWRVSFNGQRVGMGEADAVAAADAQLAVDPATLAQLYAGELDVSAARSLGRAHVQGDIASLNAFFRPALGFRLLDEF